MAAISIVENDKGLVTITLDQYEWTDFYVNDKLVQGKQYVQKEPGTVYFRAYASNLLVPVNPPIVAELKIKDDGADATAILNFSAITLHAGEPNEKTVCMGQIIVESGYSKNAQAGPIPFSQGRMTGVFSYEA